MCVLAHVKLQDKSIFVSLLHTVYMYIPCIASYKTVVYTILQIILCSLRSRSSLPSSPSFSMLMLALGASPTSDPWEWSQWIWWEVWFPEVLYECRRSLSRHYEGTELQSLVGSSTLEGGFDAEGVHENHSHHKPVPRRCLLQCNYSGTSLIRTLLGQKKVHVLISEVS